MGKLLVKDVIRCIERFAPPALQESYDNCGLQVGNDSSEVTGVLITLDVTIAVLEEAIASNCNLIVSHHPLTLSGIKRLTGRTASERIFMMAIKHELSVFSAHTNIDSVKNGVSGVLANRLGLKHQTILAPREKSLLKLITFVPVANVSQVRMALFDAGAGHIGNYDSCSFNVAGEGTFRGGEDTNPYAGQKEVFHTEPEVRVETILPFYSRDTVVKALYAAHPYEEPAFDIVPLANDWHEAGFGVVGDLEQPMSAVDFLLHLKQTTNTGCIRHTDFNRGEIKRVAVCGGSGSSLLKNAMGAGADAFVSGDFKYHQFFEGEGNILIADIGHYESEQFTKELFFEILTNKFPNFAIRLSKLNSNPIKYLY